MATRTDVFVVVIDDEENKVDPATGITDKEEQATTDGLKKLNKKQAKSKRKRKKKEQDFQDQGSEQTKKKKKKKKKKGQDKTQDNQDQGPE